MMYMQLGNFLASHAKQKIKELIFSQLFILKKYDFFVNKSVMHI